MSSNGSINLLNASPAENHIPLPVHPVESPEPPMLPSTVATTLAAHPDLNADILRAITKGLLATIARCDAQEASEIRRLNEQICGLHDRVEHYENIFEQALKGISRTMDEYPTSTFPLVMGSSSQPNGSRSWKTGRLPDSTSSKALMSPLTLSTYMRRLTQLGMARKTPSNHSPPGSTPSSLGPAVTSCTCSATLATLTTGGWLGRSLASTSSIKKPPNLPHGRCLARRARRDP